MKLMVVLLGRARTCGSLLAGAVVVAGGGGAFAQTLERIEQIPTLGGTMIQAEGLNSRGQVTGFSTLEGDLSQRPFLFSSGQSLDLGTLGGSQSRATALNDLGDVVGDSSVEGDLATHAFLFRDGEMVDLGTLGGNYSTASAMNDDGWVVGNSFTAFNAATHAFLHDGSLMVDLGTLGGSFSTAVDINASGEVAGDSYTDFNAEYHPFLYRNGEMIDLGTLGGTMALANDLNDAGQVVGESLTADFETHAFLYQDGVMIDLGTLGGTFSTAVAVNELGQVIGDSTTAGDAETRAFVHMGGAMVDLGTLGGAYSFANDLNQHGQIVGEATDASGMLWPFVWQQGTITPLNDLLPPESDWELWSALHVNDARQILGYGLYQGAFAWYLLTLAGENRPPVAVAGPDLELDCPGTVVLDGSASHDPDGDELSFAWHQDGVLLDETPQLALALARGVHLFELTVTDPSGAASQESVTVTVADTTPPALTCLAGKTLEAGPDCLAPVPDLTGSVVATDNCDAPSALVVTQSPRPGSMLGPGEHVVVVTAIDAAGNRSQCSTPLAIVDVTAPLLVSAPARLELEAGPEGEAVLPDLAREVEAMDGCTAVDTLAMSQQPLAGSLLGLGTHAVVVSVRDQAGNEVRHEVEVVVTPPCELVVSGASATPDLLQPANHQMIDVTVAVEAFSSCGEVRSRIVAVASSQPATGKGDDTPVDWEVTGDLSLRLRSELAAGTDRRVYTVTVESSDTAGNRHRSEITVTALRGMKKRQHHPATKAEGTARGRDAGGAP